MDEKRDRVYVKWGLTALAVMTARELARDKDGALPNRR